MWIFDPDSLKILEANSAACILYGYSAEEFHGLPLERLQATEGPSAFTATIEKPDIPATSWSHKTKSGRVIEVEIAVHETSLSGRKARLAVIMDITGRRQLEAQLRQAQKMEAVGMLAGGVAHDFNNLLTIITGYSQLILNNLKPGDPNRHSAEQIMKAGERAAALTKQLLTFSRRQALQTRVLELNKLVRALASMLQRLIGEDIELNLKLDPNLGRVNLDPGQLEQVIMNLVVNARDAMAKGGTVTIETSNVELDEQFASQYIGVKAGPYVLLSVSDSGLGMDEATKARLFEPFFTTKNPDRGTGLGLSTVFGIVKQSGGTLEVFSEPGKGTSVGVYLPRLDQPEAIETTALKAKLARGTETILIVEDDEMVRGLVHETLVRHGYHVIDAADPADAKRKADSYKGQLQLLITDVILPKTNGRELAQQLTRKHPEMKVLYMSGYTDQVILNIGIQHEDVAFLQKPFTPATLAEKVREVLESNGGNKTRHARE